MKEKIILVLALILNATMMTISKINGDLNGIMFYGFFFVAFLLNLNLLEKRRYQKFKKLNLELDIILKIAELENKESQLSEPIRRCLTLVCEEMEEIIEDERNKNV